MKHEAEAQVWGEKPRAGCLCGWVGLPCKSAEGARRAAARHEAEAAARDEALFRRQYGIGAAPIGGQADG